MPEYAYRCICGARRSVVHGMLDNSIIYCLRCGSPMWKVPQLVRVNWNGLKPSAGEMSAGIRQEIENAPRARDEYAQVHEAHEAHEKAR